MNITVNDVKHELGDIDPATPLLWVLRDHLNLVGTKYGCGFNQCGACTVLVDGNATKSCTYPVAAVGTKPITTIEGLAQADGKLSAVQQAWVDQDVAQCGYCQAGQIMAAEALLRGQANPTDAQIDQAFETNLCRCGTYIRIKAAVKTAAKMRAQST